MKKAFLAFLAIASLPVFAGTTVQRRSQKEIDDGAQNDVGQLTYAVGTDGMATLRVGTSDRGTVYVSDPCAVHFAPRRLLDPTEYSVVLSPGATWTDGGGICLATNVPNGSVLTKTATFRIAGNGELATIQYDLSEYAGSVKATVSGGAITLTGVIDSSNFPAPSPSGYIVLSNIRVYAYTSERHSATWDSNVDAVTLKDSVGLVDMSNLRQWEINRTAGHLAEDWARYTAASTVKLGGNPVWLNRLGTITAVNEGALATNGWSIAAYGHPVLTVIPGFSSSSPGGAFRIVDMDRGDETCDLYVSAGLRAAVTIQYSAAIGADAAWIDEPMQTSSYPETATRKEEECYRVTVPLHGDSCFWRATCTVSGDIPAELRIANCDLYVDGRKVVWKQITVNGQTIRVLAEE